MSTCIYTILLRQIKLEAEKLFLQTLELATIPTTQIMYLHNFYCQGQVCSQHYMNSDNFQ